MADQGSTTTQIAAEGKGKSKAETPAQDVSMDEDDNSSDEETGAEEEVVIRCAKPLFLFFFFSFWLMVRPYSQ